MIAPEEFAADGAADVMLAARERNAGNGPLRNATPDPGLTPSPGIEDSTPGRIPLSSAHRALCTCPRCSEYMRGPYADTLAQSGYQSLPAHRYECPSCQCVVTLPMRRG